MTHFLDFGSHAKRLGTIIHIGLKGERLSLFFFGKDGFLYLVYILVNQRVSGIDDGLRGAVVLLQFEEFRLGIKTLEIEYVSYVRPAERIDGLRIVAHDADVVLRFCKLLDQEELDIVRVLVLIDEDVLELLLVTRADLGGRFHEADHIDEQIIKIHGVSGFQSRLIEFIDRSDLVHACFAVFAQEVLVHAVFAGRDAAVLRHGDTAQHRRGFVDLLVQTAFLADGFDEGFAVGGVVNGEVARVS